MKLLKRFLLFAFALAAWSQTPLPDCPPQQFYFTNGNGAQVFDNRSIGCDQWTVVYQVDPSQTGYTLAFQSSSGINAPGTFVAYTGNTINSSASFGTAANGIATYCGLASCASMGVTVNTPWVQILVSGASGVGAVRGTFYGYRTGYTGGTGGAGGGSGGGGSGCVGTVGTPCVVNLYELDGTALAGPSNFGTSPGAVAVQNVNAAVLSTVNPLGTAAFTSEQQAVTASAVNLGTNTAKAVCVHALITNTINIYAGASGVTTSTGMEIPPGQGYCWNVANTDLVYVIASTTGASVSVTWTN
jgi:hypothetical protein